MTKPRKTARSRQVEVQDDFRIAPAAARGRRASQSDDAERRQAKDGSLYTRQQFLSYFGDLHEWDLAKSSTTEKAKPATSSTLPDSSVQTVHRNDDLDVGIFPKTSEKTFDTRYHAVDKLDKNMMALTSTHIIMSKIMPSDGVYADMPEECPDIRYWKRRWIFWSNFDRGILMDESAWFEMTPEPIAVHIAERINSTGIKIKRVVDGTAGVGGNLVHFAQRIKFQGEVNVVGFDIVPDKLTKARHNARIYDVPDESIKLYYHDFIQFARKQEYDPETVVFLSPPWGGPECFNAPSFGMREVVIDPYGYDFIVDLCDAALRITPHVILYMPRNQDLDDLAAYCASRGITEFEVEKICFTHPELHVKCLCIYLSREVMGPRRPGQFVISKRWNMETRTLEMNGIQPEQPQRYSHLLGCSDWYMHLPRAGPLLRRPYRNSNYLSRAYGKLDVCSGSLTTNWIDHILCKDTSFFDEAASCPVLAQLTDLKNRFVEYTKGLVSS